ncbi:anthranilate synthase component I [Brachybacterium sp. p3-SID1565]|uniref:Anthranilate synthase component 1 n=1 Tax=Brachybacterium epidermidis TaxID=2781983 RepID=A0ABR9W3K1_9MICO|nr:MULTISPECIES: anthranilate synthase component I [Brachybacterium]MBE9404530.1 anthranilate synthase component I [Brachybacterium epidermidis]MCT1385509.1 anthranilate synthase component I [Brachybacterium sp. p3-SID1565]
MSTTPASAPVPDAQAYPELVRGREGHLLGRVQPDRETFRSLAAQQRIVPVTVRLLADEDTPVSLYRRLTAGTDGRGTFLLESAGQAAAAEDSRWSIIGSRARAVLTEQDGTARWIGDAPVGLDVGTTPVEALREVAAAFRAARDPQLPPFTGGLVGFVAYDAVRYWEKLEGSAPDEIGLPDLSLLLAQDVAVHDARDSTVLLVANALNLNGTPDGVDAAYDDALERLEAMRSALRRPLDSAATVYETVSDIEPKARTAQLEYEAAVREAVQDIIDGEIFQVVPSKRFSLPVAAHPLDVYRVLRRMNPSPYMYLLRTTDADGEPIDVVGASPESLVTVRGGTATTHPIAGSRPRGADPAEDQHLAEQLLADPKERSEHLMLVDLARNDLQKFCDPGSVVVRNFMHIQRYSHIQHIVSTVTGRIREGATAYDALRATFPAGTLSGAPKPSALRIIDRLEPVRRGIYGGTVGYIDFAGDMDMAIAIRTAVLKDGTAHVQSGGGVVADSDPTMEHRESQSKAAAALRAVASAETLRPA